MITLYTLGDSLALMLFKKFLLFVTKPLIRLLNLDYTAMPMVTWKVNKKIGSLYDLSSASDKKIP